MAWSLRGAAAPGKRAKLDAASSSWHSIHMDETKAARYVRTGTPAEVASCVAVDLTPPGHGEVRVRMICAPVNPADLNMIEGRYGEARPLPDTPGNEGLGEIVAVGKGTNAALVGKRVLVGSEAWRERGNWPLDDLVTVPDGIDDRRACMLRVNPPTAWLLLQEFVSLRSGDWVAQNAATSGVGRAVIEIAKTNGWKTLNVVRRPESADELRAIGADAVLLDGSDLADQARSILGEAQLELALNAVGGASATRLAGLLAAGGTLVTFGAMGKEALKIPNGFLIFRDMVFRGFWLTRWLRSASSSARAKVYDEIFRLAGKGAFAPRIVREFPLDQVKEALALAASGVSGGKVLLRLDA